jgi:dUTP pyrophosphatase
MQVNVKVKKLHKDAVIPEYKTPGAAGFDLRATAPVLIAPDCWAKVPLGLAFEIPEGYEIQIRPRSGLSFKTGLIAKNTIGTIDSDYRGEVCACLHNLGQETIGLAVGERVCQGVLKEVPRAIFTEAQELTDTKRGAGGFGSTGVK